MAEDMPEVELQSTSKVKSKYMSRCDEILTHLKHWVKHVITEVFLVIGFKNFPFLCVECAPPHVRMASINVFLFYTRQRISQFPCRLKRNAIISSSDCDQSFMIN